MAGKTSPSTVKVKVKLKHEAQEMLAQSEPVDSSVMPGMASSGPVGSISHPGRNRMAVWVVAVVVILAAAAVSWYVSLSPARQASKIAPTNSASPAPSTEQHLTLVPGKNYGNKYANGLLPVGDNKFTTTAAKQGYIYACNSYAQNLAQGGGGASARGPWFTNNNTEYDINKKVSVAGHVNWTPSFSDTITAGTRTIISNDLPSHYTGTFPISSKDPAYAYDRNPNSIKTQSDTYALTANPVYGAPQCMGGQVGVMLTGVALFNAFDAGGRDAGAWEVQDGCSGHPEKTGQYHYHTLSRCITDVGAGTVIGFALDGFPITGPKVGDGNVLSTSDLDECHGLTSEIMLDGKKVTMYHYVMTQDFPYSVSCFRAKAIQPPGLGQGGGSQQVGGAGGQPQAGGGQPSTYGGTPPPPKPGQLPPRG